MRGLLTLFVSSEACLPIPAPLHKFSCGLQWLLMGESNHCETLMRTSHQTSKAITVYHKPSCKIADGAGSAPARDLVQTSGSLAKSWFQLTHPTIRKSFMKLHLSTKFPALVQEVIRLFFLHHLVLLKAIIVNPNRSKGIVLLSTPISSTYAHFTFCFFCMMSTSPITSKILKCFGVFLPHSFHSLSIIRDITFPVNRVFFH